MHFTYPRKNVTKKFSSSIVLGCTIFDETSLHSSGMRTARLLTVSPGGGERGYLPGGVYLPRGVYLPGGVPGRGVPATPLWTDRHL